MDERKITIEQLGNRLISEDLLEINKIMKIKFVTPTCYITTSRDKLLDIDVDFN